MIRPRRKNVSKKAEPTKRKKTADDDNESKDKAEPKDPVLEYKSTQKEAADWKSKSDIDSSRDAKTRTRTRSITLQIETRKGIC